MRRKTNYIDNLIAKRHYVAPEVLVERIEESDMVAQSPNTSEVTDTDGDGDNDALDKIGGGSAKSMNTTGDIFFGNGWSDDEE